MDVYNLLLVFLATLTALGLIGGAVISLIGILYKSVRIITVGYLLLLFYALSSWASDLSYHEGFSLLWMLLAALVSIGYILLALYFRPKKTSAPPAAAK